MYMSSRIYDPNNPVLINSGILLGSREAATELGLDLSEAQRKFGISDELLENPKGLMAFHRAAGFLEHVATAGQCPQFGLVVGKYQPPLRFAPIAQVIKFSPTLGVAIENGLKYSQHYSQESLWHLQCSDGYALFKRLSRISYRDPLVQFLTLSVTLNYNGFINLCGNKLAISYISFRHAPIQNSDLLERYFNAPVLFNQDFDGVVFPEHYLQSPLASADADTLAVMTHYLDSMQDTLLVDGDILTKVRHHIQQNLGAPMCNLEAIAQLIGIHPRNLQRVLKQSGFSFRQLLLDARQEVAEYYLRSSTIGLSELADILGYQNVSAFSRAFKRHCGLAPAVWRDKWSR